MEMAMRCGYGAPSLACAVLTLGCAVAPARAEDASTWRDIETKYIFGFTEGTSIGLEGEKEVSAETTLRIGKRDGRYVASETKLEFEHTPTQFMQFEFGPLVASHDIRGMTGLDGRRQIEFSGAFGEMRYLLLGRGPASPIGITVSVEPAVRRIDETGGQRVSNYELETKLAFDAELVSNRVYAALNLIYEPEATHVDGMWERESNLGVSGAVSFRLAEGLLVGAELGYFRHYEGLAFSHFEGDAIYLGPTLYWQIARKSFVTLAFATQVAGHDFENLGPLNLAEFSRHRARVKVAYEF
jgi:hypothetical protein